ncbi:MAG: acyl-CoA thioesterase [Elusimicrobia bacterium]|nr:acyl-CoA thioesterase [Elusimicrobiota bacterium]
MKRRIFYHDTDCGGVVYYGNYLKFLEEARGECLEDFGFSVKQLMDEGVWFVVKRQEIDYKYPAFYDDMLDIKTWIKEMSDFRIQFAYEIKNQSGRLLVKAITDMVAVGKDLKMMEMPEKLKTSLKVQCQ